MRYGDAAAIAAEQAAAVRRAGRSTLVGCPRFATAHDLSTRTMLTEVDLDNRQHELYPGMYADVRLESSRLPNEVIVPASAVLEREGRPLVFVVKGGKAKWTYVNPGRSNGAETIVLPDSASNEIPVPAGDTVLISGHLTLTHDAPVKVEMRRGS